MASSSPNSVVTAVVLILASISLVELVLRPPPSSKHRKQQQEELVARPERELAGFEEELENDLLPKQKQKERRRRKDESAGDFDDFDDFDDFGGELGDDELDWFEDEDENQPYETATKERRMLTVQLCSSRSTKYVRQTAKTIDSSC